MTSGPLTGFAIPSDQVALVALALQKLAAERKRNGSPLPADALALVVDLAAAATARAAAGGSDSTPTAAMAPSSVSRPLEITTRQAADLLHVQPRRVRQLLESGELAGQKVGGSWLTARQDVRHYQQGTSGIDNERSSA
ncbi:helix-turn-helix domain-containing protein [Allobranchiibius sp. GilTou38]|uniref:helix-turn-helix domain-containing protein n=1 Tax=Allobranchiibius sp. GilTou38 TaxID=2815210 RepID=UPI001AA19A57|nr:helix-turn-helix domain-containing protein [Allobranchiibius sp. GilTou38]MBO1767057.1 helix-turn-helix domain-containing protein [Allobranchiibius sp. GilTou38]